MQVIDAYGTDITDRELAAMPYTTAIVKETLRQKGIVSHVWRKALVDIELGGYRIPKASLFSMLLTCNASCIRLELQCAIMCILCLVITEMHSSSICGLMPLYCFLYLLMQNVSHSFHSYA